MERWCSRSSDVRLELGEPPVTRFLDFYYHPDLFRCNVEPGTEMFRVRLTEDPEGDYFAWAPAEDHDILFTAYHPDLVSMCFPYGMQAAEDHGEGRRIRVRVEELS